MTRYTLLLCIAVAATLGTTSGLAAAADQDPEYREREVLDPNTGTWVPTPPTDERAAQGPLAAARMLLATGETDDARDLLEDWVEENPDDERYYEGLFLLGEAYFELRDFWKAAERYEVVAENAAGDLFMRANERAVDTARAFLSGERRILWKIFRIPAYDDGIELLDRVWERVPGTPLGELALKLKADYFFAQGEMGIAEDEYANLVQQYPSGRYVQLAMLRSAEAAEAAFPGIRFDPRPLLEAAERYRQVLAAFPAYAEHENVPERLNGIREQRAAKDLDVAQWYARTRQPDAAAFYYELILREWPDTLAAAEARTRLQALGREIPAFEEGTDS